MDSFPEIASPMWDPEQQQQQFFQSPFQEQDLLALFQKSYSPIPGNGVATNGFPTYPAGGIGLQNTNGFPMPIMTPPSLSEDSSPSPPNHDSPDSETGAQESVLKRKASVDEHDDEPNHKTQNTASSTDKRAATTSRRKSTGNKDEVRLIKRKEQNRAAQRAFRERKEKHVKDLEDKVAELEAQNERAQNENENLRDLLSRLQSENMTLKQSSFTFSLGKDGSPSSSHISASTPSSASTGPTSPKPSNPLDWSSLTTFDPSMLNLLDDNVLQSTATDSAMQMNFGFGNSNTAPFTTIASNPMFMSFASAYDSPNEGSSSAGTESSNTLGFDLSSLTTWPTPSTSNSSQDSVFDDLFSGYLTAIGSAGVPGGSSANVSPVAHHTTPSAVLNRESSTPSSSGLTSVDPSSSGATSPSSITNSPSLGDCGSGNCPKSREEVALRIEAEGDSMFAPPIQKSNDKILGTMIKCTGSKFPKTAKSDQNVEVLTAWRSIRADPKYKDVDINDLCHQFTSKARCDGTKVVLEPSGVSQILDTISQPKASQQ